VDKLLGPDTGMRARATTPLPASYVRAAVAAPPPSAVFDVVMEPGAEPLPEPGAPVIEPGAPPLSMTGQMAAVSGKVQTIVVVSPKQKLFATLAALALLASAAVIAVTLKGTCAREPTPIVLRVANLPVKAGEQLGKDA